MRHAFIAILTSLLFFGGCDSANKPVTRPVRSEQILIIVQTETSTTAIGFNFDSGRIINLADVTESDSNTANRADIAPAIYESIVGNPDEGVKFNSGKNTVTEFNLYSSDSSIKGALNEFNGLKLIPDVTVYSNETSMLKEGQIYIVKTGLGKFAKLLIKKVTYVSIREGDDRGIYGLIQFEYVYQPDGSKIFE